jgi:hypothetical protein
MKKIIYVESDGYYLSYNNVDDFIYDLNEGYINPITMNISLKSQAVNKKKIINEYKRSR